MENEAIEQKAKKNIKLYTKYKMFSYDFLFYYAISVLYLSITKKFSMPEIMYLNALNSSFCIIFFFLGNIFISKLNLKRSIILGNILVIINMILFIIGNNFITFALAHFFGALGVTLKSTSEGSMLYSSLRKLKKSSNFAKIEGIANSKYYYYEAISSIISGFLFVFNNYLPIILCCVNLIISLILSINFSNVDKFELSIKPNIHNTFIQTKQILRSKRLKAIYVFSFIFTGIVTVSSTLYKAILIDIGIKNEYSPIVVCIASIFVGLGAKTFSNIEAITKNKTLKFLSFGFILGMFIIGIIGYINRISLLTFSIFLLSLAFMGIIQGAYRVALKKYILSFTTHKIRNIVTSTYYIAENLGSTILAFLIGILLNFTSNSMSCMILAIFSFLCIAIILQYMKHRLGLRPEEYDKSDIYNTKI